MTAGRRIALVGATGTLGQDLLAALEDADLGLAEVRVFAGDRSLGETLDFRGEPLPVEARTLDFTGLDAVVLCTPAPVALDLIHQALRAEVPCIDCSGALLASSEVPLVVADLGAHDGLSAAPLISAPTGPTLVWAPVLSVLQREAGLLRVVGTVLHSASSAGRGGIEALSAQTLALIGQQETFESPEYPGLLAFGSAPHGGGDDGPAGKDGDAPAESDLVASLHRLLGRDVAVSSSSVQVPSFAGQGAALWIETERPLSPAQAGAALAASPGIEVLKDPEEASTRDAVGTEAVRVARLRADRSASEPGRQLMFWLAADPVRLAALNAVKLLRARLGPG
ncbi:MAG: Asd/ArgC dimerization domain-containing protein [Myxococcota bacterium]|nr:Asd/ArgC dimerization domain-containing protein [Myxococcota bacterium]